MKSITIENLTRQFGHGPSAVTALADVNFTIQPGELFFLLGPSGCGKTTLLRAIAGLVQPTAGRVYLGEQDVTDQPVEQRRTAMVFQNYALWPHMTVEQNVQFGPKMQRVSRQECTERADTQLRRVEMDEYAKRKPNQLSGGQQQRVALARALAANAECLLLDEPLSNLDARLRTTMRHELRQLIKASGTTGVYVTHDQKEALSMADRLAVMHAGRVVQVGQPEEVYNRPASRFVADFIGEANFLTGQPEGQYAIRTPAGVLQTAVDAAGGGETITCCVRPERVELGGPETCSNRPNLLAATVESQMYLGESRQYSCRLECGQSWRVTSVAPQQAFTEGDRVRLHVPPEAVWVIDE
jgi:iron(III) transport system ATP-binding protein